MNEPILYIFGVLVIGGFLVAGFHLWMYVLVLFVGLCELIGKLMPILCKVGDFWDKHKAWFVGIGCAMIVIGTLLFALFLD